MDTINRSAIVVRPAQPFLNWLHQVDPTSAHLTLEDLQREPTIYLVPECDSQEQAIEYLGESARDIFEEQLDGWYRVEELWPWDRSIAAFRESFEYRFHSMPIDLANEALIWEDS